MSDTVEVVAKTTFMMPAGLMHDGDRFTTTRANAAQLAANGLLHAKGEDGEPVDRATAYADAEREKQEKREATEAKEREKLEEEQRAAEPVETADAAPAAETAADPAPAARASKAAKRT